MAPATSDFPKTSLSPTVIDALGRKYLGRAPADATDDDGAVDALLRDLADPEQRAFGDYELLEVIGKGGMGVVYKARQTSLDREVAIKLMVDGYWAPAAVVENFRREAQAAARLHHPGIVEIYDTGEVDGLTYFSMRLVRGESLAQRIARGGPLQVEVALRWLRAAAEAIDHAHRLGLLHLDLKPGNLLLGSDEEPMVADFGLARLLDAESVDEARVAGTPAYMAPEQVIAASQRLDRRTDVYGLGAVMYEALTGHPPFDGASVNDVFRHVLEQAPADPRQRRPALPDDVAAIAMKCLAKRPEERYATARELADDIGRFLEGRPVSVRPQGRLERFRKWLRREPLVAGLAASVVAALIAVAAVSVAQWRQSRATVDLAVELLAAQEGRLRDGGNAYDPADGLQANAINNWIAARHLGAAADDVYRDIYQRLGAQGSATRGPVLLAWMSNDAAGSSAMERLGRLMRQALDQPPLRDRADADFLRFDIEVVSGTRGLARTAELGRLIDRIATDGHDAYAMQYATAVCLSFHLDAHSCKDGSLWRGLLTSDPRNGASLMFAVALRGRDGGSGIASIDELHAIDHWHEYNHRRLLSLRAAFAERSAALLDQAAPAWSSVLSPETKQALLVFGLGAGYVTGARTFDDTCAAARKAGDDGRPVLAECGRLARLFLEQADSVWTGRMNGMRLAKYAAPGTAAMVQARRLAAQLDVLERSELRVLAFGQPVRFLRYLDDLSGGDEYAARLADAERNHIDLSVTEPVPGSFYATMLEDRPPQ